ncbi:MAG: hypothetical protein B6D37_04205 [Sphingobacteriales bacterium UTBCD1]|jgi:hypothetical protein|nr:MAG: hypothetical protein B6D37_04205 [Sphingobacteriales bacterium UTBCD1]
MNINRHNYEEYFILYMDNELSSEECRQVELFIQQNPDLKDEMDVLLQSKLIPEPGIFFENKEELLHSTENTTINISNYEEWLVLYLDNELTAGEKAEADKFIETHPAIKNELGILSKVKLQPEEDLVFPGKESLYRRTERARIISMHYWRVAAAAILIIGIGISTIFILNNKQTFVSGPAVSQEIKTSDTRSDRKAIKKSTTDQADQPVAVAENRKEDLKYMKQQQEVKTVFTKTKSNGAFIQKNILPKAPGLFKNESPLIAGNTQTNNLPVPGSVVDTKINTMSSIPDVAINQVPNNISTSQTGTPPVTNTPANPFINKETPEKTDAVFASQDEKDNKKTRGFFRKVTRLFEKTTRINPTDDNDRLLIGSLAVKLN